MDDTSFNASGKGLMGELAPLSLEEATLHFRNSRANYLLDRAMCVSYLNRFLAESNPQARASVWPHVEYLMAKCLQLSPFERGMLRSPRDLADAASRLKVEVLEKTNFDPETFRMVEGLGSARDSEDIARFLHTLLDAYPAYAVAAGKLLAADFLLGRTPCSWLHKFKCPRSLQGDFNGMLFRHYAQMGLVREAQERLALLDQEHFQEVDLNCLAELARLSGDTAGAIAAYARSLELDGTQAAVRFRLAELQSPSVKRPELVREKRVAICLYSYNKAELLRSTLASLAASNIGSASVTVLLNGCSDHSLAVAEQARALFPDNPFTVIPLHVNIGAPGARNWLINLPATWESDYVAFLDDDVDVQADWLEWFLSVAEGDEKIAVVGCKVVFPGQPAKLQYLFRYVSVANGEKLRLSLCTPNHQYDNGTYDFIRETRSVMGCLHLLRTAALRRVPCFDIRFSPSQVDDIDHDLCLCLEGYKVMYCGLVTCVHHQSSGVGMRSDRGDMARTGNCIGNDIKLFYKHVEHMDALRALDNLSLLPWADV